MVLSLPQKTERDWQTTADLETVRLAVIGLGGFARERALPAIDESEFCKTGALVSGDPDKAAEIAADHDAAATMDYEAYRDGAHTDAYDGVYIATPNALHLPDVEAAAHHGKAVICEKPLEATVERARRLVDACSDAGVPLMTAYRMQTDPMMRYMRDLVQGGHIGEPVKIHGEFSIDVLGPTDDTEQWRLDGGLAGGGCLMDVGVYPLNATRFVLNADATHVSGTMASPDPAFDEVEEHISWWMTFEGQQSPTGVFTASYQAHLEDTLQILGTRGQLRLENAFGTESHRTLHIETAEEERVHRGPQVNEIAAEFDYFAHAVRTGAPIEPDGIDGLRDVEAMIGVYESAETGERVPF